MGIASGLKGYKQQQQARNDERVPWIKVADGQQVKLHLLNELDEDSPLFNPEIGAAVIIREHTSPYDWHRKSQCTKEDEGKCWACEQITASSDPEQGKKWRTKDRFYTNVLVEDGVSPAPEVKVWSLGTYRSNTFELLLEHAEDNPTVGDFTFKLKRKGSGQTDTTYLFSTVGQDKEPIDINKYKDQMFDLKKVVKYVPYDEQARYFGAGAVTVSSVGDIDTRPDEDNGGDTSIW